MGVKPTHSSARPGRTMRVDIDDVVVVADGQADRRELEAGVRRSLAGYLREALPEILATGVTSMRIDLRTPLPKQGGGRERR
jgi:hypothetical protein